MRLAAVVCILHATTARQEDLLLLREDQCADALFVAQRCGGAALAFIGLTEAYDSSVKLALHTFGLEAMPGDFAHLRVKKGPKCQGADSIKLDAKACRATFAFNQYDHEIYEHAHRLFCSRLQSAGLRGDEAVETELASSNLCGALDFSKVDDVCGRLETRDVLLKKAAHDARCAHRGPGAQPRVADESIGGLFSRLRGA